MNTSVATSTLHRDKFTAALLAFVFGGLGVHRLYLRNAWWWVYAVWLIAGMSLFTAIGSRATMWIVTIALLPVWVSFAESMAFAVMPDARWDARWNPMSSRRSANGWNCVLLAIAVLLLGTSLCMVSIILGSQYYFEAQVADQV